MVSRSKTIGQIIHPQKNRVENGQKLAIQFLKLIGAHNPLKFASLDLSTAFFPQFSLRKSIKLNAIGCQFNSSPNLSLIEAVEKLENTLLMELLTLLPAPVNKPHKYAQDELWCFALIQALIQDNHYLFIHDDSPLLKSNYQKQVADILYQRAQIHPILFTQATTPVLRKLIQHQITLVPKGAQFKKKRPSSRTQELKLAG